MSWPTVEGTYVVGDPTAPIAICVLTSGELMAPLASIPGVAIAGEVQTANLGLERIVLNVVGNPAIRFLLLCGRESRLFRPGQSLAALVENGVDESGQVRGALGHEPILRSLSADAIGRFRSQVELVDWTGVVDTGELRREVEALARRRPAPVAAAALAMQAASLEFTPIAPGGRREPLRYDPRGYFVIALDRPADRIVIRHYRQDHTPAHEMRARSGSPILLGLIREGLVSQLSHAGYLGAELARAEAALRLGLRYAQDRPLRSDAAEGGGPERGGQPPVPAMTAPLDAEHLAQVAPGEQVQLVARIEEVGEDGTLAGVLLDPVEPGSGPRSYRPSEMPVQVRHTEVTRVAMGSRDDLVAGAVLRIRGELRESGQVVAEAIAVLTGVVTVLAQPARPPR